MCVCVCVCVCVCALLCGRMNDGVVKERVCTSNSISLRGGDDELKLCSEKEKVNV